MTQTPTDSRDTRDDPGNLTGPRVQIDSGPVRGADLGKVHAFRGIPYVAPPVGERRFRAPQPVTPWDSDLDATAFGPASPQSPSYTMIAVRRGKRVYQPVDEDCLTLNVVTPSTPSDDPRPVMVFIHGGAYLMGTTAAGIYSGHSLVTDGDVVYVSINYRLGALGYLDLTQFGTAERPIDSNLGLRDQVAALQWVQRNIAAFGGDTNNVTVFGESAGGNAVTTLLATPAAEGLFHRAIAQSSAPRMTTDAATAQRRGQLFVELLGGADRLFAATPAELGKAGNRLMGALNKEQAGSVPYGPVVDGDFLPENPETAIAAGRGAVVPLIIGTNRSEATLFTKMPGLDPTPDMAPHALGTTEADIVELSKAYPGYPSLKALNRTVGDYLFWAPTVQIAQAHALHNPTYFYRYDFSPRTLDLLGYGPTHASELLALFDMYRGFFGWTLGALGDRGTAIKVGDRMRRDWISFARTGTPAGDWPEYDVESRSTLVIDDRNRVEDDPAADARLAWAVFEGN